MAVDVMSEVLRERCDAGVPVIFSSHQLDLVERICDRVGIVRGGSMVACGSVTELRAGSPSSLVIDAPDAPEGWTDPLAGVRVLRRHGSRLTLKLGENVDDQTVLRAALATGPVREFARELPSLAELYRHVVRDPVTDQGAAAGDRNAA
jgi:ABC-2 type transport system ATP-binding protein